MAFSAEKNTFLFVFGILIISDAIYANTKETNENSVGRGLFTHLIWDVIVVVVLEIRSLSECTEYVELRKWRVI